MDSSNRDEIAGMLRAVLVGVEGRLRAQDVSNAWDLIDAGEPGVALETLCIQLYEFDVAVSRDEADLLRRAGTQMGMDSSLWTDLTVQEPHGR